MNVHVISAEHNFSYLYPHTVPNNKVHTLLSFSTSCYFRIQFEKLDICKLYYYISGQYGTDVLHNKLPEKQP